MNDVITTQIAPYPKRPPRTGRHMGRGRPTLYTDGLADAICDAIRNGASHKAAAQASGVSRETMLEWAYAHDYFAYNLARAEAEAEIAMSTIVFRNAKGEITTDGWRPALEWLKQMRRGSGWGDVINIRNVPTERLMEIIQQATLPQQEAVTENGLPAIVSGEDVL